MAIRVRQSCLVQMQAVHRQYKVPPKATPLEGEVEVAQQMPLDSTPNMAVAVGEETKSTHLQVMLAEVPYSPLAEAVEAVHL